MACEIEDFDEELDGIDQELPIEDEVVGCKDPSAINYNEMADIDDPCLCEYLECPDEFIVTDTGVVFTVITNEIPNPIYENIKEECCKESIVGQPVSWDGEKCVVDFLTPTPIPDCPDLSDLQYVGDTVVVNLNSPQPDKPILVGDDLGKTLGLVRAFIEIEEEPILQPLLPEVLPNPCDIEDDEDEDEITLPGFTDLSEECCLYLGEEFGWEFIDGVCYWNPPKDNIIEVGISENDIIIDRDCYSGNYIDGLCINGLTYRGVIYDDLVGVPQNELYNNKPYYIIEIPEQTELYLIWNDNLQSWQIWSDFDIDDGPFGCLLHRQSVSDGEPFVGYGSDNVYTTTTFIDEDATCNLLPNIDEIKRCQLRIEDLGLEEDDIDDDIDDEGVNEPDEPEDCCDTINVNLWFYLEKPNSEECEPEDDVTVSLGFYYGNNVNDDIELLTETISTYNLSADGYCNWTNISTQINNYDGQKFKIKLIIDGLKDCCDYNFYVDDISVDCVVEDTILSSTPVKCPGFKLKRIVDNKKSWVYNDGDIINREFAPSTDADIPWRYTNYFEQSGVFEKHSNLVLNSKEMELTFNLCSVDHLDENINIFQLIEYKNNFQNFWVQFIEQFVPATTIFVAGEKWCTTDEKICTTYDECDYDNKFELNDLGLIGLEGGSDVNDELELGGGETIPVDESDDDFGGEPGGDYGDNSNPNGLITMDNFIGVYIPYESFNTETTLTLSIDDLELLNNGGLEYRNRFAEPIKVVI